MHKVWLVFVLLALAEAVRNHVQRVQPVGQVHAPVVGGTLGCLGRSSVAPGRVIEDVVYENNDHVDDDLYDGISLRSFGSISRSEVSLPVSENDYGPVIPQLYVRESDCTFEEDRIASIVLGFLCNGEDTDLRLRLVSKNWRQEFDRLKQKKLLEEYPRLMRHLDFNPFAFTLIQSRIVKPFLVDMLLDDLKFRYRFSVLDRFNEAKFLLLADLAISLGFIEPGSLFNGANLKASLAAKMKMISAGGLTGLMSLLREAEPEWFWRKIDLMALMRYDRLEALLLILQIYEASLRLKRPWLFLLSYAVQLGNALAVQMICETFPGMRVDELIPEINRSPLMIAVERGHTEIVKYFLKNGIIDPMTRTARSEVSLLQLAMRSAEAFDISRLLLYAFPELVYLDDQLGRSALHHAAGFGRSDCVEMILMFDGEQRVIQERKASEQIHSEANFDYEIFPRESCFTSSNRVVKLNGPKRALQLKNPRKLFRQTLDYTGRFPIHHAAIYGHFDTVRTLLNLIDYSEYYPTDSKPANMPQTSRPKSSYGYVRVLYDEQARKAPQKWVSLSEGLAVTPLHEAVVGGHLGIVIELVRRLPQLLKWKDHAGRCPFLLAVERGEISIVQWLMEQQPDWRDFRDGKGNGALHLAVVHYRRRALDLILSQGRIDLDARNGDGLTVMQICERDGRRELERKLRLIKRRTQPSSSKCSIQ